jgi:hypothetical protein
MSVAGERAADSTEGSIVRRLAIVMTTVFCLAIGLAGAEEAKQPDATLRLRAGSVAAGVGISWGKGTLTYKGKDYPVSVDGLTVGKVGVSEIEASGKVYNLKKLEDFNGNYTSAGAGMTVGGGGGGVAMVNQNGVRVDLVATTQGLDIAIAASGVDMKIKE